MNKKRIFCESISQLNLSPEQQKAIINLADIMLENTYKNPHVNALATDPFLSSYNPQSSTYRLSVIKDENDMKAALLPKSMHALYLSLMNTIKQFVVHNAKADEEDVDNCYLTLILQSGILSMLEDTNPQLFDRCDALV